MPVFRWYEGNRDMWLPEETTDYSPAATSTRLTLTAGGYSATDSHSPFKIVFTIANGATYTDSSTGLVHYTAGTITAVSFYNAQSVKLADMTGLSVKAAAVLPLLVDGYDVASAVTKLTWDFWSATLIAGTTGATITGSNSSGGEPPTYWGEFWQQASDGDDIVTTRGNDTVNAGGGSDYIMDAGGADVYNGGSGNFDLVSYSRFRPNPYDPQKGIVADLALGRVTGGDGLVDRLTGIEAIRATIYDDVLLGDAANNVFFARGGSDRIDGRGGFDTAHYASGGIGRVLVNLTTGIVRDVTGGIDRLTSIEGVVGTNYNDSFIDAAGNQRFEGMNGNDVFSLSAGNDTVTGGMGADTFKFVGRNFGYDHITDFDDGEANKIHVTGATKFSDLSIYDSGLHRVIAIGTSRIILDHEAGLDLTASDFIFG